MGSIVGFSVWFNLSSKQQESALAAQVRALTHFKHLETTSLNLGESTVVLWGHPDVSEYTHRLSDGSFLVLIGSPLGEVDWRKLEETLKREDGFSRFDPPWDGRFVLLHISADGKRWTMWNDWLGSIPVFHTQVSGGRIASTLEPIIVAAAGFTSNDIFSPGLVSMMINGHFFSDWTLYKGMKTVPPDCRAEWDGSRFHFTRLWTVKPSQDRWETGWDDLVDEMYELTYRAIFDVLKQQDQWILPLSSGMDSRLIAGVGAKSGINMYAYAWGEPNSTDVVNSRKIARALGLPWKHIQLRKDFLQVYTKRWADWFGSGLHFHGMYVMNFLDALKSEPKGPVVSGSVGDTLAGDIITILPDEETDTKRHQLANTWHMFWSADKLRNFLKFSIDEALEANVEEIRQQINLVSGTRHQKLQVLELWAIQRLFISFQPILCDYWRGVGTPYINRDYARFCLSLPRAALDERRLLGDVFRRYYGPLAVIPGTYAKDPFILTGKYLVKRRIAGFLPPRLHLGPLKGFGVIPLRLDVGSIQTNGRDALWPLYESPDRLKQWMNIDELEKDYQVLLRSKSDIESIKRLRAVQTLSYRLLEIAKY